MMDRSNEGPVVEIMGHMKDWSDKDRPKDSISICEIKAISNELYTQISTDATP